MKKKKSPPSERLLQLVDGVSGATREEVQIRLRAVLSEVRYAGDLKQLAERYGLHYLKSKRMRTRELAEWIVNNHPASKEVRGVKIEVPVELENLGDITKLPNTRQVMLISNVFRYFVRTLAMGGVPLLVLSGAADSVAQLCHDVRHGRCDWNGDRIPRSDP